MTNIDAPTARFLAPLIGVAAPNATGLFELTLPNVWWYNTELSELAALDESLTMTLGRHLPDQSRTVVAMTSAEVVGIFKAAYGDRWLKQISTDPSDSAVLAAKQPLLRSAQREFVHNLLKWIAYWATMLAPLTIYVATTHAFFLRLFASPSTSKAKSTLAPVAIQLGLMALIVIASVVSVDEYWPAALLVPALMATLLAEAWAKFCGRSAVRNPWRV
ncbi:MAG: hypothetical protein ABI411_17705 [Tahibacter sp.]